MERSPNQLCIEWHQLKKPVIDEIMGMLDANPEFPAWLTEGPGGPGPEPDRDSEAHEEWWDALNGFIAEKYPGLNGEMLEERYPANRYLYTFFNVDRDADIDDAVASLNTGAFKIISDTLAHYGSDELIGARLCMGGECEMEMFAVTRLGILHERPLATDLEADARLELHKSHAPKGPSM